MAGGAESNYRMLILLEEGMENLDEEQTQQDRTEEPKESKKMHEFVDELVLPFQVDEIDSLNDWFDKFDEEICIPNEGHIKYEITSDGIIVLILDKEIENVLDKVKEFVQSNHDSK
ncbi:hypothetical protein Kpol_1069p3 [Vanderwaltozyma polyspora DSM 70294]|uniref:Uncharacterized protein n=1 Tax=Vanderwaltozyma polyspora (strain ATCC 22028 / DSM 70294 / BCRC 21397 / CBS 2163 / NBRC 10782 / NRRL Y-8283 / UCD 57-17) TaxID=436907 RepID=A7TRB3_VANPO|nr:uncharacterized protein Kpol_1069p3 [Vanderwaltozyma polyspora DSM 70294]EDO15181.1 hypothetical protein Kpol_1069p3 [Vanderwaltozyma polyspora DSM 70294]